VEQIKHALQTMPTRMEIERRNRTLLAFMLRCWLPFVPH
jgi:hypothetical protein